jgi:hypothetical protein
MKARVTLGLIALFCTALASASELEPRLNQFRTWTNHEGRTIRAACAATDGTVVQLVVPSGKGYLYNVADLSYDDQCYAAELRRQYDVTRSVGTTYVGEQRCAGYDAGARPPARGHAAAHGKLLKKEWEDNFRLGGRASSRRGLSVGKGNGGGFVELLRCIFGR